MQEITREKLNEIKQLLQEKIEYAREKQLQTLGEIENHLELHNYLETLMGEYKIFKINKKNYGNTTIDEFVKNADKEQFEVLKGIYENLPEELKSFVGFYYDFMENYHYFALFDYVFKPLTAGTQ